MGSLKEPQQARLHHKKELHNLLKPRLTLPTEPDPHEAIAKAAEAKRIPTIEESWEKIFSMKNSKKDKERLLLVKEWM